MLFEVRIHDDIKLFADARPSDVRGHFLGWLSLQGDIGASGILDNHEWVQVYKKVGMDVLRSQYEGLELKNWRFLARVFRRRVYFFYHFYRRSYNYEIIGETFDEIKNRYLAIERGTDDECYIRHGKNR